MNRPVGGWIVIPSVNATATRGGEEEREREEAGAWPKPAVSVPYLLYVTSETAVEAGPESTFIPAVIVPPTQMTAQSNLQQMIAPPPKNPSVGTPHAAVLGAQRTRRAVQSRARWPVFWQL
jgi:hypothetical protein